MSDLSHVPSGEVADIETIVQASIELLDESDRPVRRGQHPKMHGLVRARFVVESQLNDEYRVGLFQEPGKSYDAWVRFSNGSQTDDRKRDAHGMAIKLIGVEGAKLLSDQSTADTHDFVLVDHPRFFIRNAAEYAKMSQAMVRAAGKGKRPSLVRQALFFLPTRARMLATLVVTYFFPTRLAMLARMIEFVGNLPDSPLTNRYWSATPYRFGSDRVVKYSAQPGAFDAAPVDRAARANRSADFLREAMVEQLDRAPAVFLFQVQFARDDRTTPVEDPTVEWPESVAPFVTLARIIIEPQPFDDWKNRVFGDELSFTPWHALAAHEPLGGINRTRKVVYDRLSRLRHKENGWDYREPTRADHPGDPAWVSRFPTEFAEVLEQELDLILDRRVALFGRPQPELHFPPVCDEDRRLTQARSEAMKARLMGLSFSGGGIRSGTFAVGFLQGLASVGILKRFDYLSTVSGGGYAGGWLAGWIARNGSIAAVEQQLDVNRLDESLAPRLDIGHQVVDEEPETLRHLRAHSSYLFPQPGMLKPDTWTVLMIWVRNVLINLGMLLPMALAIVAAARLVVYLYDLTNQAWIAAENSWNWSVGIGFGVATLICLLTAATWGHNALNEFRAMPRPSNVRIAADRKRSSWVLYPVMGLALLITLFIRWVLWQVGAAFDQVAATPPHLVLQSPLLRFVWDYLGTHLGLLDPPNVLLHILGIGGPMAFLSYLAARRNGETPDRSTPDGVDTTGLVAERQRSARTKRQQRIRTFVHTAFLSWGFVAVLFVVLEVGVRQLDRMDRPDLMAMLAPSGAMMIFVAGMIAQVALLGRTITEAEREWWARMSALLTLRALIWSVGLATVFYLPGLIYAGGSGARTWLASGWVGTATLAVLSGRYVLPNLKNRAGGLSVTLLASLASVAFLAGFVGLVGLLASVLINSPSLLNEHTAGVGHFGYYLEGVKRTGLPSVLLLLGGSLAIYAMAVRLIDVNLFSLHAMYTNRLVRCYLGASRPLKSWANRWINPRDTRTNAGAPTLDRSDLPDRDPNPITGFDPSDDIPLFDLRLGHHDHPHCQRFQGPQLLINTTLNLVEGHDLAWRDRKGESFTLSPLFCGSKGVGYSRLDADSRENLTLGRAMAISGAAVDPNMSFYQSSPLTALLTIFNARLGYWIAKPKPLRWAAASPKFGDLLLTEFLGRTDASRDFVHLSDGGHFENLGVYELVRRRCRYIVAVDAGSDEGHDDDNLANLIRLCRIDFGVRIKLDTTPIEETGPDRLAKSHVVVGKIEYDDIDNGLSPGILVYVKISLTGDEPADVLQYAQANPTFPHQATDLRQSFDEAQFESYRCLGDHIARKVFESLPNKVLEDAQMSHREYTEQVFDALKDRWSAGTLNTPHPPERLATEWANIQHDLRSDPHLAGLDRSLFPELLTARASGPGIDEASTDDTARAELHMVIRMMHLMEDLWRELGLDLDSTLPVNRGWMNRFRRWTSTDAARRLWPTLSTGFAPEFVRFCRERLDFEFDGPTLVPLLDPPGATTENPFVVEALGLIVTEFAREWPEADGGKYLTRRIDGVKRAGTTEPLVGWLIVRGNDDPAGRVACGLVLVSSPLDRPVTPESPAEFFVWLRPPFRSIGIATDCIRAAIREAQTALEAAQLDATLTARYPSADGDDPGRNEWVTFHLRFDFEVQPLDPAEHRVTTLILPAPAAPLVRDHHAMANGFAPATATIEDGRPQ